MFPRLFVSAVFVALAAVPGSAAETPALRFAEEPAEDRAALIDGYAEALRDLPFDYGKVGSVLEAIACLEFSERFAAPDFGILANVPYESADGRTLGELDLVLFDRRTDRVAAVYEVKLTGNPDQAAKHGRSQLNRLRRALAENRPIRFLRGIGGAGLRPVHFDEETRFLLLGGSETRNQGWDVSLDLRRAEGDLLQERLR